MAVVTAFVCQACGYRSAKWLGRCPDCGAWSSLVEEPVSELRPRGKRGPRIGKGAISEPRRLVEIEEDRFLRTPSGIEGLDRVLGGGVVAGGAALLAGEPGIGKSTLLLQLAQALAEKGSTILYATAEESPRQLRLRAERLGVRSPEIAVVGETELEALLEAAERFAPRVLLVDSIQALVSPELASAAGSIGQVRQSAHALVGWAKRRQVALFLVGHITKEGTIAGPKALEHLVDCVLTFEGEREGDHRILRTTKNRFGPSGELALFAMTERGLEGISDPSSVLLAERQLEVPGSAVAATVSGLKPLLVEIQALVVPSGLATPRRVGLGVDSQRLVLILAVLERFLKLGLSDRDVFVNAAGGLQLKEPAVDLAIAAALLSAVRDRPVPARMAFCGEVGLLGEVRPVGRMGLRAREAQAHGFEVLVGPRSGGRAEPGEARRLGLGSVRELQARILDR